MKLPQLSLRDLFWLILVCALAVGWWAERSRLNAENRRLVEANAESEHRGFDAGLDEVERFLKHHAKRGDEAAHHILVMWQTEARHAIQVELDDFGSSVPYRP